MPGFSINRGIWTQNYWGLLLQSQTPETLSFLFHSTALFTTAISNSLLLSFMRFVMTSDKNEMIFLKYQEINSFVCIWVYYMNVMKLFIKYISAYIRSKLHLHFQERLNHSITVLNSYPRIFDLNWSKNCRLTKRYLSIFVFVSQNSHSNMEKNVT